MQEQWNYDGFDLTYPGQWAVESVVEGLGLPKVRGGDLQIPYQHGTRWMRKRYDRRKVSLAMWVRGRNRAELDLRIDHFSRVFGQPGQHILSRTLSDGSVRHTLAEVADEIHFVRQAPSHVKFALDLELADPFFYAASLTEDSWPIPTSPTSVTHQHPGTAQAVKMHIILTGPLTNPMIRNTKNGVWVQFGGTLQAGETVVLNTADFTCVKNGVNLVAAIRHSGDAYWMVLEPRDNKITITTDAVGGTIEFRYKAPYF